MHEKGFWIHSWEDIIHQDLFSWIIYQGISHSWAFSVIPHINCLHDVKPTISKGKSKTVQMKNQETVQVKKLSRWKISRCRKQYYRGRENQNSTSTYWYERFLFWSTHITILKKLRKKRSNHKSASLWGILIDIPPFKSPFAWFVERNEWRKQFTWSM